MDYSDKTVFKQPRPGGDRTVVKPSPGGAGAPRRTVEAHSATPNFQTAHSADPGLAESLAPSRSINHLVSAADTLIVVYGKVRQTPQNTNLTGYYTELTRDTHTI